MENEKQNQKIHDLTHMIVKARRWFDAAHKFFDRAEKWFDDIDKMLQEILKDDAPN